MTLPSILYQKYLRRITVNEEERTIIETHNVLLEIFNTVKKELGSYPEYEKFKNGFSNLVKQSFPRREENRLIHIQQEYFDQELYVDFVVNAIPVKVINNIHGMGPSIMLAVLSSLSCKVGVIINIVDDHEPEFTAIQNPKFSF